MYFRTTELSVYCPAGFTDTEDGCGNIIQGSWRDSNSSDNLQQVRQLGGNRYTSSAATVRDSFTHYFSSMVGKVHWQDEILVLYYNLIHDLSFKSWHP